MSYSDYSVKAEYSRPEDCFDEFDDESSDEDEVHIKKRNILDVSSILSEWERIDSIKNVDSNSLFIEYSRPQDYFSDFKDDSSDDDEVVVDRRKNVLDVSTMSSDLNEIDSKENEDASSLFIEYSRPEDKVDRKRNIKNLDVLTAKCNPKDSTKMMVEYRDNLSVYYPAEVLEVMDGGVRLKFVDDVFPSAWYPIADCRYVKYQKDDRVFKVGDVVDVCLPQKTGKFGYQRAKISGIYSEYLHFEVLEGPPYGMAVSVDECRDISCVQPLSEGLHLTTLNIPKNMQADKDVLSPILVKRFPCCVIQKSKDGTSFVIYSLDPTVIACIDAGSDLLIEE
uniref:Tudor domain-containing protein n=1 Tax=Panagrolaimus sp. JU765 TaxID=591449 RepID=A0AC34Q3L6_9BILA